MKNNFIKAIVLVLLCWTAVEANAQVDSKDNVNIEKGSLPIQPDFNTSTFEARIDGKVLEGTGYTPDQIILRKDYNGDVKPQIDAAIEYIMNYH